ncbi:MAG: NAD(P)/FAD-dependent oxidoreductase, partial [Clostridiales Family XIII bacterium]|nr:NAD(P)/FAD-dependent oxidoreductase [Clostridiales Family XIII bacterium]
MTEMQQTGYDVIVIGAGAAGLAAARTFTRKCSGRALLIDKNEEAGRKLLATGNGRCNLTNRRAGGYERTAEFFAGLGVALAEEDDGRVYPAGRQAAVVRDTLVRAAADDGAGFLLGHTVSAVGRGDNDDFVITVSNAGPAGDKTLKAAQVIIATGGKAGSHYGSTGDGFTFARSLGIEIDPILPSLVKLTYGEAAAKELSALNGVRVKAKAALIMDGGAVAESAGEAQFTKDALSGICIFDLSSSYDHYKQEGASADDAAVILDLAPDMKEDDIAEMLSEGLPAGLPGIVNVKLAEYITKRLAGQDEQFPALAADMIKHFEVPVSGTAGWKEAQTTCGGVSRTELDEKHFEAKKAPGLYFAGEVISSNLPSGGY